MDGTSELFGDADYGFSEHGLLVVTNGRGTKRTYSTEGWRFVEEYATPEAAAESRA